jgi:hypothetical protein
LDVDYRIGFDLLQAFYANKLDLQAGKDRVTNSTSCNKRERLIDILVVADESRVASAIACDIHDPCATLRVTPDVDVIVLDLI